MWTKTGDTFSCWFWRNKVKAGNILFFCEYFPSRKPHVSFVQIFQTHLISQASVYVGGGRRRLWNIWVKDRSHTGFNASWRRAGARQTEQRRRAVLYIHSLSAPVHWNISAAVWWIAMKCCNSGFRCPQDESKGLWWSLTLPLMTPRGWCLWFFREKDFLLDGLNFIQGLVSSSVNNFVSC